MSVRIRLRRVGRKKQPYFRVVVAKGDAPRDGAYIEELGFYNPRTRPAFLTMDLEKVDAWIGKGAVVTGSAKSLIRKARKGGDDDIRFAKPGEEAPRLKTATKPERRPEASASPAQEPEGPPAEKSDTLKGAQPDAEKEEPAEAPRGGATASAVAATETEAPKSKKAVTDKSKTAEDAPPTEPAEETSEEAPAEAAAEATDEEPAEGKAEVKAAVEPKEADTEEAAEPKAEAKGKAKSKTKAQAEAETESDAGEESAEDEPAGAEADEEAEEK